MGKKKNINRSGSIFHQQIIRKYQVKKRKYFKFPMLVFYKNLRRFLSPRNIMPVNVRLFLKIVPDMDKVVTLKYHKVTVRLPGLDQALANRIAIISPGKTIFSQFGYLRHNLKKVQTSFVSKPDIALSPQSNRKRLQERTLIQQTLNYLQIGSQTQPWPVKERTALSVIETGTAFSRPSERKRLQERTSIQPILNYLQIGSQTQPWPVKESTALSVNETGTAFSRTSERKRLQERTSIQQIMNYLQIGSQIRGVEAPSLKKQFSTMDGNSFYPQTTSKFSFDNTVYNHFNINNIGIYPLIQNKNHPLFYYKLPVISSPVNFLINKRVPFNLSKSLFNTIFQKTSTKPIIQNYGYNIALGASNHLITHNNNSVQNFGRGINSFVDHTILNRTTYLPADGASLIFSSQQTNEQKVEQIKKIAMDATKEVAEKSISVHPPLDKEIQKHIDLNRISEQVYQLIERKITIESERRGIL